MVSAKIALSNNNMQKFGLLSIPTCVLHSLPITTVTNGSEPPTVVDTGCVGTSNYLTDIRAEDPPPPTITFIPYADGEIKVHSITKADFLTDY